MNRLTNSWALTVTILALTLTISAAGTAHAISQDAYTQVIRGNQMEAANNYRGAEAAYRQAIGLDPYDELTYLRLADVVAKDDRKDEAISLYRKALELNPGDAMVHLSIAQLLESKNQLEPALTEYQALIAADPDYIYANLPIARLEKRLNHKAAAATDYQKFLTAYPKHYDAQRELAGLELSQEHYAQAAESYKTLKADHADKFKDNLAYAVSLNQSGKPQEALATLQQIQTPSVALYDQMAQSYVALKRPQDALDAYQKALAIDPKNYPDLYLKVADLSSQLNRPDQTAQTLETYLTLNPTNRDIRKSLADVYLQQKNYPQAMTEYQQLLTYLPETDKTTRADALRQLGYINQAQKQTDEAIKDYQQSLALEDNRQTRVNLALAYHQTQQYDKAIALYRQLLVEDPTSESLRKDMGQAMLAQADASYQGKDYAAAITHYQDAMLLGGTTESQALLGIANSQYAEKDMPMAYTSYQRVLEKDPNNLTARYNKAQLDIAQKNYLPALENLRYITDKDPTNVDALRLMANTYTSLNDPGNAILNYQKALTIAPQNPDLLLGLGNSYRQTGKLDDALKTYEQASAVAPQDATVHYDLGSLYSLKNQLDRSAAEYRKALELNPSFTDPLYGLGTTLEKQHKLPEALAQYQQYLEKAPPSDAYVPYAKERVTALSRTLKTRTGGGHVAGAAAALQALPSAKKPVPAKP